MIYNFINKTLKNFFIYLFILSFSCNSVGSKKNIFWKEIKARFFKKKQLKAPGSRYKHIINENDPEYGNFIKKIKNNIPFFIKIKSFVFLGTCFIYKQGDIYYTVKFNNGVIHYIKTNVISKDIIKFLNNCSLLNAKQQNVKWVNLIKRGISYNENKLEKYKKVLELQEKQVRLYEEKKRQEYLDRQFAIKLQKKLELQSRKLKRKIELKNFIYLHSYRLYNKSIDCCKICLNEFNQNDYIIICKPNKATNPHKYHYKCLYKWMNKKKYITECPYCKTKNWQKFEDNVSEVINKNKRIVEKDLEDKDCKICKNKLKQNNIKANQYYIRCDHKHSADPHLFHLYCLKSWMEGQKTLSCPICKFEDWI